MNEEMTEESLMQAMKHMWFTGGRPEEIRISNPDGWWDVVHLEEESDRICTPAGLKAIFPSLK